MSAAFDSLNFTSDVGKSVGSLATGASSLGSQGAGALSSALANKGLSLDGIKNIVTSKTDSISSPLGEQFNRAGLNLFASRSENFNTSNDPAAVLASQQTTSNMIQYPPDNLRTEFLTINFAKYKRPNNFNSGNFETVLDVHLPIPRILTEQHTIDVAPTNMKTIGAALPIAENLLGEVTGQGNASRDDYIEDAIGFGYSAAVGYTGETIGGVIGQYAGAIPNPHISVFFNGVDLRPAIEFSWMFTPRSPSDSDVLKKMLKQIKSLVLPTISRGNGNVMDYPHMVKIAVSNGLDTEMMPLYKRGLITAININYTPNGPSFFKGTNSPTFVAFSFLFQEIEIITANDYGAEATSSAQRLSDTFSKAQQAIQRVNNLAVPGATSG